MTSLPILVLLLLQAPSPTAKSPEQKAVDYLVSEVDRWPTENQCFSCHNNGDGARTLILSQRMKYDGEGKMGSLTLDWLQKPEEWSKAGEKGFGDPTLAQIQFAAALTDAVAAGLIKDKSPLLRAAELVASRQEPGGSWVVDAAGSTPAAVTYGPVLATYMARRTLERTEEPRFKDAIARADEFLRTTDIKATVNAAAVALAMKDRKDGVSADRQTLALKTLVEIQNADGGWGAYAKSPSAAFESALALLALNTMRERPGAPDAIARGVKFLLSIQYDDGGWPAALNPGAPETYARHLSTSAWATQAVIATRQ